MKNIEVSIEFGNDRRDGFSLAAFGAVMRTAAGYPFLLLDAPGNSPCLVRNSIIKRSNSQGCSI
jgi:hypothetical protein